MKNVTWDEISEGNHIEILTIDDCEMVDGAGWVKWIAKKAIGAFVGAFSADAANSLYHKLFG